MYPLTQWLEQQDRPIITLEDIAWVLPKTISGFPPSFVGVYTPNPINVRLRCDVKEWRELTQDVTDSNYRTALEHLWKWREWIIPLPIDSGRRYLPCGSDTRVMEPILTESGVRYSEYLLLGVYPGFTVDGVPTSLNSEPRLKYFGTSVNQLLAEALKEWWAQSTLTVEDVYIGLGTYQGGTVVIFGRHPGELFKMVKIVFAHGKINKISAGYIRSLDKVTWIRKA